MANTLKLNHEKGQIVMGRTFANRLLDSKHLFIGVLSSPLPYLDLSVWLSRNTAPGLPRKVSKKVVIRSTKPSIFDFC